MDRHTTTQPPPGSDEATLDEATRWHLRLRESDDRAVRDAYETWLAGGSHRAAAMAEIERLWGKLARPAIDLDQPPEPAVSKPISRLRGHGLRRYHPLATLAASALIVAGITWLQLGGYDRLRADAHTTVGETRRVTLEDGSVVTLNTDTAVSFQLSASRRNVQLLRGEAYFEVSPDPARPFIVDSAAGSARVLGTAFNMRLTDEQARVSVVHGRVSVASAGATTVLSKGQSAWLRKQGIDPEPNRDALTVQAWQRGQIVFYRTPLSEVVAELGRYRRGQVVVRGQDLRNRQVSGAFDVSNPDEALELVQETLGIQSLRLGRWLTVMY